MRVVTMNDRWMTLHEVADYLQLSRDLIYRLSQKGRIPATKVGGRWRFKREKIDQWMEEQQIGDKRRNTVGDPHA